MLGHLGRGINDMLAVVQHQQHPPTCERPRDTLRGDLLAGKLKPDRGSHRGRNQAGIGQRRKLGEPHAVREFQQKPTGRRQRQPRLANAAGAGEGNEAMVRDKAQDLAQFVVPANQIGDRLWQVARRQCRPAIRRRSRQCALPISSGGGRISPVNW